MTPGQRARTIDGIIVDLAQVEVTMRALNLPYSLATLQTLLDELEGDLEEARELEREQDTLNKS